MTLIRAPRMLTYGLILAVILAVVGWVKPLLEGPDVRVFTYRKPVPVPVETVRWMREVKRERVVVPVQVIREVTPAQAEKLEAMDVFLPAVRAKGGELLDVVEIPKAEHGGDLALTLDSEGKVAGTFLAKPVPRFALGGIREAGVEVDPFNSAITGFVRQDLVRVQRVTLSARAFATASPRYGRSGYGIALGASVRF